MAPLKNSSTKKRSNSSSKGAAATAHGGDVEKTRLWWTILRGIASLNLTLWALMASGSPITAEFIFSLLVSSSGSNIKDSANNSIGSSDFARYHLVLSGIFTAVCAYRSFWPRIDLERFVLVDSYFSSMVFGRSAATIAEISFATQCGLMVYEMGLAYGGLDLSLLSCAIVALLTTAQVFCWFGVLTKNHVWHAVEESLWAFTFTMICGTLGWVIYSPPAALPEPLSYWRTIAIFGSVVSFFYVLFMVTVDVPMYLKRWWSGEHDSRLGIVEGFQDALHRRVFTQEWSVWQPEVAWLTGYFWLAVWMSMGMAILPR